MLIIIKELQYTEQVMPSAIAHHTLVDAQTLSKQWLPSSFPAFLCPKPDVI